MDLSTEGAGSPKTIDTLNESLTGPAITSDDASHKIDPGVAHAPFKLWNPPTEARPTAIPELEDLEPTAAEVVAAYQAQARKSETLRNAPLITQEIRDRQQRERYKKWPNCVIRIRFHNQMQLEKTFPSTIKIKSIYAFVRGCLNEEAKPVKFVLYQPPARELKVSDTNVREKTLLELQLAPSSVLLLRFLSDELNDREKPPPLHPSVLSAASDFPIVMNEPPSEPSTRPNPTKGGTIARNDKETENKLARLLKLPPRK
ncbi:unnamed protein product [Rhizoctonia solani]|uniref:UBX domain-containing protein n=1 Tax=Rhizoctonia solani TaxID=456999 RepID=A0A8H3BDK6_9AGAM|nr:unnamed protein product [Rhizoctonia solani]